MIWSKLSHKEKGNHTDNFQLSAEENKTSIPGTKNVLVSNQWNSRWKPRRTDLMVTRTMRYMTDMVPARTPTHTQTSARWLNSDLS